ncbi:serine/threonine-protein phosphatase 6 regulatory ankyrin repeat subunit B-like [Macrobrachium nipponense]|uniref:serine/threonine-protein phosphatase 6 regulatory ankyrin repeat subunit B-like n=1 Tax=Macrobrachium nipponense TaxID=159736 RepID=UPI0030C886C1
MVLPRPHCVAMKFSMMPHIMDLHQAILTSDMEMVRKLAKSGLDLGTPVRGTTALSLTVYHQNLEAMKILLQAGAPVDRRSKDHLERIETPLITSIRLGYEPIFIELVTRGARLDLCDFFNQTPLWFAVKEQRLSFVRTLLKNGAPINFTMAAENPLNIAMQFLGYRGRREMALELVAAGMPLIHEDYRGRSPLYYAMKYEDFDFFRLLVEAGVKLKNYEWLASSNLLSGWSHNIHILEWIREELKSPSPLKRQCRSFIYKHLREMHNRDVRPLIRALTLSCSIPLPPLILKYLLMENLLASVVTCVHDDASLLSASPPSYLL